MKKKEIIITGATGFVGKNLVKKIVKHYPKVKIICLTYSKDSPFESIGRKLLKKLGVSIKNVDLAKNEGLTGIPKNPKIVIHLAAQTDTSLKDHRVNDIGTMNLYKAFGKLDKRTHFIHIGTMIGVVGRPNCKIPIDESTPDYPTNEYTRTKVKGEKFIAKMCQRDGFKLTILRPNTIYGKGVRKGSLFDMVRNMISENSIITRINWPGKSALVHVDDVVQVILNFIKKPPLPGTPQKYLVYDENLSIPEISKKIHKYLGKEYYEIKVPTKYWKLAKNIRILTPLFEKVFPYAIYNYLWRFGIIIDDVVCSKSQKLFKKLPNLKPIKFSERISDIFIDSR